MSISKKIIVFLLIIISITLSIFIIILFNRIEKIETIENKFIEKNIKENTKLLVVDGKEQSEKS